MDIFVHILYNLSPILLTSTIAVSIEYVNSCTSRWFVYNGVDMVFPIFFRETFLILWGNKLLIYFS